MVGTAERGASGVFDLREDAIRFPDGTEAIYTVLANPESAFVVPVFANGDTTLVRQWRHAWNISSWEVPAGTFNAGETALECARRELVEETGLVAARYRSLGVVRGAAILTGPAHLFLAEEISESARTPEKYEQDMEVMRLPFMEAIEAALEGQIVHAGSVTALCRAARTLKLL